MTPPLLATVKDVEGHTVVVLTEAFVRRFLVWFFSVGLFSMLSAVALGTVAWRDVTTTQRIMLARLDALVVRAPAPADTTRIALRAHDARLSAVELDLQQLRRDLGRPR